MKDFSSLLHLVRPVNCVMVGLGVLVGAVLGGGYLVINQWYNLSLGFLAGIALTGSAMAINDFYDREIDAINEPNRPIPSGAIAPKEALITFGALSFLGLFASWLICNLCLMVAIFSWVLMFLYSTRGKKTGLLGNLMVSTCIGLPFIYGGITVIGNIPSHSLIFSLIAFLTNSGREVTKGILDIEGDKAMKIRTAAVLWGEGVASKISTLFYFSVVLISLIPFFLDLVSIWYLPFIGFTDLGLIYLSLSLLSNPSRENSRRVKNWVLLLMFSGLLGLLAGSLF